MNKILWFVKYGTDSSHMWEAKSFDKLKDAREFANNLPKSEIRNPKEEIQNPKEEIQNPKEEIQNPKEEIQNPKSEERKHMSTEGPAPTSSSAARAATPTSSKTISNKSPHTKSCGTEPVKTPLRCFEIPTIRRRSHASQDQK